MYYVTRDAQNAVTGLYQNRQFGADGVTVITDETPLAEDHPDIVAYQAMVEAEFTPTNYIPKLVIVERLEAAGIRAAAKAALAADDYQQDRWDAATQIDPNDAGVRTILTAAGADLDVILAPV